MATEYQDVQQTVEDAKIAAHIRSKVEECRASANRIANESIWMTNIAYLCGYAGVVYNSQTRSFQPTNRFNNAFYQRNRTFVNKILPTVQNRLARLCKNAPKFDVAPESSSEDDKEAARLAVNTLLTLWNTLSINEKRLALGMWVQQCGHAWIKVFWDDCAGKHMYDPLSNEMDYEGDVGVEIASPFEIFVDPSCKSTEDIQRSWLIQAKVRKLEYFKKVYPEKGHLVKEEDAWLLSIQYEQRINSLNTRGPTSGSGNDAMKGCAIELTKYEAPSKEYPKGRMIVVANGVKLADKDLPIGCIPFVKFDDIIVAGKLYSEAIITHLRPIQDNYNELIRRRGEWVRKLLSGKLIAARGSGLAQESVNDESGEIVYYTPVPNAPDAGRPVPMTMPMIPQYAYAEEDKLIAQFNDISGISEVSRGTLPSASIPAIGMQLLVEQDDTRIGVITEQHEHAWAKVGQYILKFVEVGYSIPRKLKMSGPDSSYMVRDITGDMLNGNTDVKVIRGSLAPGSKTLRNEEIINRYERGLLGDPADPKVREKVLAMTEFGDVSEMWVDHGTDMSQIRRGMDVLKSGVPVDVDELDNHALWIQEMNRFRKTEAFDKLDPITQKIFRENIEQHIQWLVKLSGAGPLPPPPPTAEELNMESGLNPDGTDPILDQPQITEEEQVL